MREITIQNENGRNETWAAEAVHCPGCGHRSVWSCEAQDDYYVGRPFVCLDCRCRFYLPGGVGEYETIYGPAIDALTAMAASANTSDGESVEGSRDS